MRAPASRPGLYAQLLGASWAELAEPVRCAHEAASTTGGHGRLRIAHGRSRVSHLIAALLRLPRASDAAETQVVVTPRGDVQYWRRTFDDRCLTTRQYAIGDSSLGERIGPLEFRLRLEVSHGSLVFRQVEAALVFGAVRLRVPAACAPRIEAREDPVADRQTAIHVTVALPAVGSILTYTGIIEFDGPPA